MATPADISTVFGIDDASIYSAPVLMRDVSFPITNNKSYQPLNEVAQNMPVFMGRWEDGMTAPTMVSQEIEVDRSVEIDDCDFPVVRSSVTTCDMIAPSMKHFGRKTDVLKIVDLVKPISSLVRQRNIAPDALGQMIFDANGNFKVGVPYAQDVFQHAIAAINIAMMHTWTKYSQVGDAANPDEVDGLYTQLNDGWANGDEACDASINVAQTINWYYLTDATASGVDVTGFSSPDATTVANRQINIHGVNVSIPPGLNFAQFLEEFWVDYITNLYTDKFGEVMWEMHLGVGEKYTIRNMVTCMQPCDNDSNFDSDVRTRWQNFHASNRMRLEPSGKEFVLQQSTELDPGVMYFGPRSIGGNYTYGLFFSAINQVYAQAILNHELYGQQAGTLEAKNPLIWKDQTFIENNFEQMACRFNWEKIKHQCFEASVQMEYGFLATARHLWLKVTGMSAQRTLITVPADTVVTITE